MDTDVSTIRHTEPGADWKCGWKGGSQEDNSREQEDNSRGNGT